VTSRSRGETLAAFFGAWLLGAVLPPPAAFGAQAQQALQRAAILVQEGRLQEADQEAQRALADPATRAAACSVLGAIRLRQDRLEEGVGLLQEAIRLEPHLVGAQLNLAQAFVLQGKIERALPVFRRVLELDPKNAAAQSVSFAELLVEKGRVAEGVGVLERARRAQPSSYELAFALGGAYLVKGDRARALEAYDLALAAMPGSVTALRQAAVVAEKQGELERSLSYWMRAKKAAADDPQILLGFGRVCLKMDLLDDAEPALTRAAEMKPGEPAYQYTLAVAKVGKRQYEAAQGLLEPIVARKPRDGQLQYALGSILYMQGHLAEAATHLQESLRLDPDQLASPYYLALVARDQGRDAEAIERLEQLLRRYPDHASSCEALGGLLMNGRRYDEAERLLRRAVELNPKSVKGNYQLGLLLARTGRREEADRQLAMAKSLREEDDATSRLQLRLLDPEG